MGLPKMLFSTPTFNCPECGNKMKKYQGFFYNFCPSCKKRMQVIKIDEEKTKELRELLSLVVIRRRSTFL